MEKLIFIFYQLEKIGLKKLITIDERDVKRAKLNDYLLSDLYNLLCEFHAGLIRLMSQFNKTLSGKEGLDEKNIDLLFKGINVTVEKILSIQKLLCLNPDEDHQSDMHFLEDQDSKNDYLALADFYQQQKVSHFLSK